MTKAGIGETLVVTLEPGSHLGEIALVRETMRTATIRTRSRIVLLEISKAGFDTFFMQVPDALC